MESNAFNAQKDVHESFSVPPDRKRASSWSFHQMLQKRRSTLRLEEEEIAKLFPASTHSSPRRKTGFSTAGKPASIKRIIMRAASTGSQVSGGRKTDKKISDKGITDKPSVDKEKTENSDQKRRLRERKGGDQIRRTGIDETLRAVSCSPKKRSIHRTSTKWDIMEACNSPRPSRGADHRTSTKCDIKEACNSPRPSRGAEGSQSRVSTSSKGNLIPGDVMFRDLRSHRGAPISAALRKSLYGGKRSSTSGEIKSVSDFDALGGTIPGSFSVQHNLKASADPCGSEILPTRKAHNHEKELPSNSKGDVTSESAKRRADLSPSPRKRAAQLFGRLRKTSAAQVSVAATLSKIAIRISGSPQRRSASADKNCEKHQHDCQTTKFNDSPLRKKTGQQSVLVIGCENTGKSSLIGQLSPYNTSTAFLNQHSELAFWEINNEKNDLWFSLSGSIYLLLFSLEQISSFENALKCLMMLKNHSQTVKTPIVLVGNKADSPNVKKEVQKDAKTVSKRHNVPYLEVCANLNQNVDNLWEALCSQLSGEEPVKTKISKLKFEKKKESRSCEDVLFAERLFNKKL